MFIDTHAHLNFQSFKKDIKNIIGRAKKRGVGKIVVPGADILSSTKAVEIASTYPSCHASLGIHPHHIHQYQSRTSTDIVNIFITLSKRKKVVAIGETGIDYYHYKKHPPLTASQKQIQKELFLLQISLARELNLPLIIHCRDAYKDLLNIIYQEKIKKISGVIHCFEGNIEILKDFLKLGLHIGFNGNITYPENRKIITVIKNTPLNRMLLETDSPFLSPYPKQGSRNEPANLATIANFISKIRNLPRKTIENITCRNALNLFRFKDSLC